MNSPSIAHSLAFIYVLLFIQQLIAASTHFIAKFANAGADPFTIVFLRGGITVVFFAVWFLSQRKQLPHFDRADLPLLALLGALNIPCNQVLFVAGLRYTLPANASLAYALVPAFVLAIMVLFYREKTTPVQSVGIGIAFAGALLILFERGIDVRSEFFLGNMLELSAAVSWAWFSILGKRLAVKYGALYATALAMLSGMLWYTPLYGILSISQPSISSLTSVGGMTWLYALYLGIAVSVVGYFLWYYALARIPASNVAVFSNLQSVLVTVLSVVFLGEVPSVMFIFGAVCVIAGVVITQRGTSG